MSLGDALRVGTTRGPSLSREVFQDFGGDVDWIVRGEDDGNVEETVGGDIEDEGESVDVSACGHAVADVAQEARTCIR